MTMSQNAPSAKTIFDELESTFEAGVTKDLIWRKSVLRKCSAMILENHQAWTDALIEDLGGGEIRAVLEIADVTAGIDHALAHMDAWAADRRLGVGDPLAEIPGLDRRLRRPTPKGVCLTISAWNLPITILLSPAVGMIAAGNCVIFKPSELAPATAALAEKLIHKYLPREAFRVVQGGVKETTALLELPLGHICYTGSTPVGKVVMAAAAKNLTPCTLELGGKNPVFVDKSAKLKLAADRIMISKTLNAGQWCINPDYALVEESIFDDFVKNIIDKAGQMIGENEQLDPAEGTPRSQKFCNHIINRRHTERIMAFLQEDHGGEVICGDLDKCNSEKRFVPFTVVLNPRPDSKLMREEIFGPIFVILSVKEGAEAALKVFKNVNTTPLALYVYSEDKGYTETVLENTTSGSVGVNVTSEQIMSHDVPFGGVGQSGFGSYHGQVGFEEFSHMRSVMYRTTALPLMFLPSAMHPVKNAFPPWVHGVIMKKLLKPHLFVPSWWLKRIVMVGVPVAIGLFLDGQNVLQMYDHSYE